MILHYQVQAHVSRNGNVRYTAHQEGRWWFFRWKRGYVTGFVGTQVSLLQYTPSFYRHLNQAIEVCRIHAKAEFDRRGKEITEVRTNQNLVYTEESFK